MYLLQNWHFFPQPLKLWWRLSAYPSLIFSLHPPQHIHHPEVSLSCPCLLLYSTHVHTSNILVKIILIGRILQLFFICQHCFSDPFILEVLGQQVSGSTAPSGTCWKFVGLSLVLTTVDWGPRYLEGGRESGILIS